MHFSFVTHTAKVLLNLLAWLKWCPFHWFFMPQRRLTKSFTVAMWLTNRSLSLFTMFTIWYPPSSLKDLGQCLWHASMDQKYDYHSGTLAGLALHNLKKQDHQWYDSEPNINTKAHAMSVKPFNHKRAVAEQQSPTDVQWLCNEWRGLESSAMWAERVQYQNGQ